MSTIKLEFPVWVRHVNQAYHVRPLLVPGPEVIEDRYQKALKSLSKQIRSYFSSETLRQDNLSELLWLCFNPDLRFESIDMEFRYGQRYFHGPISVAWFPLREYTVVVLPAFDNHFFISAHKDPRKADLVEEVIAQIQHRVRRHRNEYDEDLIVDAHSSASGEYCTTLDLHLHLKEQKIEFVADEEDLYRSFFRQSGNFSGRDEIAKVGEAINDLYPESLERAYYREAIIGQLRQSLYNREQVPIVLLGARQVGKTAILHETVYQYVAQHSQDPYLLDHMWTIDPTRIIAGMSVVGMWQQRMESILEFVLKPLEKEKRQDILHFRNVVALFRIGKSSQNNMTLSDMLKPYMERRQLQLIFEATPGEWDVVSEMDRGFTDMCKVIRIEEPTDTVAIRMLGRVRNRMEEEHRVTVQGPVLLKLIDLQRRFFNRQSLVGGVASRLQQLAVKFAGNSIDEQQIIASFEAQTHMNRVFAVREYQVSSDDFEHHIGQRLIGQPDALRCLANLLQSIKAGLNDPHRPYGSFLFIGPTGVGKTEAAKVLADYLFTHEDRLLRFDMNEFIDDYAVNRLVGDLSQPEGQLTSKVRFNPFCVLLFDEIEKAHPEVHNLLLQVLGEGRLTDALGRTVSFVNTVIILTSNLGAERVGREIQIRRTEALAAGTYEKAVYDFFRPEFINRIDQQVVFNPLLPADIAQIAHLQLGSLLKRHGFARRKTFLDVSGEVLLHIAEKGFDPQMGGRALKRQIEKEMTVLLADQLVGIPAGNPIIFKLRMDGNQIVPQIVHLVQAPTRIEPLFPPIAEMELNTGHFQEILTRINELKVEMLGDSEEGLFIDFSETSAEDLELRYEMELRDELYELEKEVEELLADFEVRKHLAVASSRFQIKTIAHGSAKLRWDMLGDKRYFHDLYNRIDLEQYLDELVQAAETEFSASLARYNELLMTLAFLRFRFDKLQESGIDQVIVSMIQPSHEPIILGLYRVLYPEQVFESIATIPKGEIWDTTGSLVGKYIENHSRVYLEGPGIFDLFRQEVGCHWMVGRQDMMIGKVAVQKVRFAQGQRYDTDRTNYEVLETWKPADVTADPNQMEILRVYSESGSSEARKLNVTDLRTGIVMTVPFSGWINYDPLTVRSLFYASLPKKYRVLTASSDHENT